MNSVITIATTATTYLELLPTLQSVDVTGTVAISSAIFLYCLITATDTNVVTSVAAITVVPLILLLLL